ncbi:MAG: DEAD/DEAH box helicase [Candidatus Paceibacterota bacterium]
MIAPDKIVSIELSALVDVLLEDLGHGFLLLPADIKESENKIQISTTYAKYLISVTDNEFNNSESKTDEARILKVISVSKNILKADPLNVKYFLRRQFIADEELFNLYLKRGKEILPHEAQEKALFNLQKTRESGFDRALAILATGLGKTILSALDVKSIKAKRVLFIVHINEILKQTKDSFEKVIPDMKDEMGFYTGKQKDKDKNILFASIQTMGRNKHIQNFPKDYFDYIIIDETHHTAAPTYKKIFDYFTPKFILGLTATPDRMDRKDILGFYNNNVVFEMGQEDAIEQGYLVPFNYIGLKDNIDYSDIYFNGFKYDTKDLNKHLLIDERDQAVIEKFKELAGDRKTIAFCASIEHAERCVKKFKEAGINAISVHSQSENLEGHESEGKDALIKHFRQGKCQIAFVVDMFNEGVDIPDVSCLLFLRPTESKTIFIQHMGRGLRVSPKKENTLILDFIGNYKTANVILEGLNIKNGLRGLKKVQRDGKDLYIYDTNGCAVIFDSEVVNIFKVNEATYSKEIKNNVIGQEWREYSSYIEKWTKDNLYWKRGQQNQYFEVNFEAIKIIKENPEIKEENFIQEIQKIVDEKYPRKNMTAGFRALILSKITGFISADSPLVPMPPFNEIYNQTKDYSNVKSFEDILTNQLEKVFYWNSIYGSYNKYVESTKRVSFKDFKIYPFFFIYDVMIRLVDDYGSEPFISKFEFNTFLAITKDHSEAKEVAERIVRYRNNEEKHQIKKLLDSKNNIDPRFYGIVHYCKYIEKNKNGIILKSECIDEVRKKAERFKNLWNSGKLIIFNEKTPEIYQNMLYSNKNLLLFHEGK